MLKLLIFDLDGTLADTSQDITNALNHAMKPFGTRTYSVDETKAMVGSGISRLVESLVPVQTDQVKDTEAKKRAVARFLEHYDHHLTDNTLLYTGVKETLSRLGTYKKAVLSNKREKYSRDLLETLGILNYFDLVWGSDSVREKKPSPVPILDLMNEFGVSKGETAIIGDSNYDIEAGMAAEIKTIGVTYGFRSREFLKDADTIVDRFEDLLAVLS
jgi:phosphoglycolate phosphatase